MLQCQYTTNVCMYLSVCTLVYTSTLYIAYTTYACTYTNIHIYIHYRWIDITYLSENLRVTRGNKGTTFILKRIIPGSADDDGAARLAASYDLKALRQGAGVGGVADSEVE